MTNASSTQPGETGMLGGNIPLVRAQFPSLDHPAIFFDNPGGTQIARQSAERMQRYLLECNANHEGAFATSRQSDDLLERSEERRVGKECKA
jgi:selenocysteine lyase/cysteine desulfurase